jgi:fumarylacetoacetate (FAA) hydrolase
MYQGASDNLLSAHDDIPLIDPAHGMDFESEVAVITDGVPMGTKASQAASHIKLVVLMNDVSLRELIPRELGTGFGFFHGKPPSSFSPFALTPDELGDAWRDGKVRLPLETELNGHLFGAPNACEMYFSFFQLIEHAAKTRPLSAGTIIGSGTVSNEDATVGSSCLVEQRMREKIATGAIETQYLKDGDRIVIRMRKDGRDLFGTIDQRVRKV